LGVEAPRDLVGGGEFFRGVFFAGARIVDAFRAVGGVGEVGEFGFDFFTSAGAGVEDTEGFELVEGFGVGGKAVALAEGGLGVAVEV